MAAGRGPCHAADRCPRLPDVLRGTRERFSAIADQRAGERPSGVAPSGTVVIRIFPGRRLRQSGHGEERRPARAIHDRADGGRRGGAAGFPGDRAGTRPGGFAWRHDRPGSCASAPGPGGRAGAGVHRPGGDPFGPPLSRGNGGVRACERGRPGGRAAADDSVPLHRRLLPGASGGDRGIHPEEDGESDPAGRVRSPVGRRGDARRIRAAGADPGEDPRHHGGRGPAGELGELPADRRADPGAKLVVLPGAPHRLFAETADAFNSEVLSFLGT